MRKEQILQHIIDKIRARTYLEIGVQRGKNFFKISAPRKVAVDPQFVFGYTRKLLNIRQILQHHFFQMTSDEFFNKHAPRIFNNETLDIAFIDGLHTYEQSLRDFQNCLKYLSPKGIVVLHDCNPTSPESAMYAHSPEQMRRVYPDAKAAWTGDVWKTIVHIRSLYAQFEVCVIDCDFGVGIVRKSHSERPLNFNSRQIQQLTYKDLENRREEFLNLKNKDYLKSIIDIL